MISLGLGWTTLFLVGTDLFVISPLLPRIGAALRIPGSEVGWMVTAFALAYVIGGPRLGAVADRVGRRTVLSVALAVFAAANGLTAVAPVFVVLLAARALAGLAASGITPSVYGMVGTAAPPRRRATWLSIVTSGLLLALATGAPAGSLISSIVGWRGVFIILCALAVVVLALNVLTTRGGAPQRAGRHEQAQVVSLSTRIRAVSITGVWALAVYGVYTFLGTGLRHSAHFGAGLLALALVLYGLGAAVGNLSGGPLADRFGGRRVTTISLLGLALIDAALAVLADKRLALLIGMAAFALAAYPYFSAHQTRLIANYDEHAASLMAWNNTAMYIGILIASAIGGSILTATSFGGLFGIAAVIAFIGALTSRLAISNERPAGRSAAPPSPPHWPTREPG